MIEVELTRRNIPYRKYGALKFLEAAHIKDLMSFLRVLENPRDQLAWTCILRLLEGVGPAVAKRACEAVAESGGGSGRSKPSGRTSGMPSAQMNAGKFAYRSLHRPT